MRDEMPLLVPIDKFDLARAEAAVAAGYPAVAPVLPQLLKWMQDCNWPVARVLAPFLATIGSPLLSHIRDVLATDDNVWKYWVLSYLVEGSPPVAEALREELRRYAHSPTPGEAAEGLSEKSWSILKDLN